MPPIDASLFAHIENDFALSGTYKLEGNSFAVTLSYLEKYLNTLKDKGEYFPQAYATLLQQMKFLIKVEAGLSKIKATMPGSSSDKDVQSELGKIVQPIVAKLKDLALDTSLFLPGGWTEHGLIYQFTARGKNFEFTVINSGAGLQYHAKKSALHKELYNPLKSWQLPCPIDFKELEHFIGRLLIAMIPFRYGTAVDEKQLYEIILTSISYVNGVEVAKEIADYMYTAGQLSGTCAQRSLHQMLKINAPSFKEYLRFIFGFKRHAQREYSQIFLQNPSSFSEAAADQIHLAIQNNLKILNIPAAFEFEEVKKYSTELLALQKQLNQASKKLRAFNPVAHKSKPFKLIGAPISQIDPPIAELSLRPPLIVKPLNLANGTGLLQKVGDYLKNVSQLADFPSQYYYLEQFFLQFPMPIDLSSDRYQELQTLQDFQCLQKHLVDVVEILVNLQDKGFGEIRHPIMNHLFLSAVDLHTRIYQNINKISGLPLFGGYSEVVLCCFVKNEERNPFIATNHPIFDDRIKEFQITFNEHAVVPEKSTADIIEYYTQLLDTEPSLKEALTALYNAENPVQTGIHAQLREAGLEALYMIACHTEKKFLGPQFDPIIKKIEMHLAHEQVFAKAINFLHNNRRAEVPLSFSFQSKKQGLSIRTPLQVQELPKKKRLPLCTSKYILALPSSPVFAALDYHVVENGYDFAIPALTANEVQLKTGVSERIYFQLRVVPSLQIVLTLDYFVAQMELLTDRANQCYVEANLFQPGLLLNALKREEFLPQLDRFLKKGFNYFIEKGLHTPCSLFFIRLDFLVSRYLALYQKAEGTTRLVSLQKVLVQQISLANSPEVAYSLREYLFLIGTTLLELGATSEVLLPEVYKVYCYLQSHSSFFMQDKVHQVEMERAIAVFQMRLSEQPDAMLQQLAKAAVLIYEQETQQELVLSAKFPLYNLVHQASKTQYQLDALEGKLFKEGLAQSGLPSKLQNNILLQRLGLSAIKKCFMNRQGTYFILSHQGHEIRLAEVSGQLIVNWEWTIQGKKRFYELQAFTEQHKAKNKVHEEDLPDLLKDDSMNYWRDKLSSGSGSKNNLSEGLLVRDNIPVYSLHSGKIWALNEEGYETGYYLVPLADSPLQQCENSSFILALQKGGHQVLHLARYGLVFEQQQKVLRYPATGEIIVNAPSPIHPLVAGLLLQSGSQTRHLVPVARFYAGTEGAEVGDFYPVIHDTQAMIARTRYEGEKSVKSQKFLWRYQNSERYLIFRIEQGIPIADTVASTLYLAYLYLATHQPKNAWNLLNACYTRFSGLKGEAMELQFILWIINDLPHCLKTQNKSDTQAPVKNTPAYVACQLKALSLLCDYLLQNDSFPLEKPLSEKTANAWYAEVEYQRQKEFLTSLPELLYQKYSRLQSMSRHLEHFYTLSILERRRLLDYYYKAQPKDHKVLGALGVQWVQLHLEVLLEERDTLLGRSLTGKMTAADAARLTLIQNRIDTESSVSARSTLLQQVKLNLSLPARPSINPNRLKGKALERYRSESKLRKDLGTAKDSHALEKLSSEISDSEFYLAFPTYLHWAFSEAEKERKILLDFCTKTLLSKRHIPFDTLETNIPFLCNILYRVLCSGSHLRIGSEFTLRELVESFEPFEPPSLWVYQAQDNYEPILASSKELMESAQRRPRLPITASHFVPKITVDETVSNDPAYKVLEQYTALQRDADTLVDSTAIPKDDIKGILALEEKIGKTLYTLDLQKRKLASKVLERPAFIQLLLKASEQASIAAEKQAQSALEEALTWANKGPEAPGLAQTWAIERHSQARALLTVTDLRTMYLRSDLAYIVQHTGLSAKEAQGLYDAIHKALVLGIVSQRFAALKSSLKKAQESGEVLDLLPALESLVRTEIPQLQNPAIVLLQYEEGLLLHTFQAKALESLLQAPADGSRFKSSIKKITPGGGKTKVLLPILVERMALGYNLVVVEVPPGLLATNQVDLNRTSQRLFGKRAYRFEFNRDSLCSPQRLEDIYTMFSEIISTRSYLVTTAVSMQSLELKYIELLLAESRQNEMWQQQIRGLDRIIKLLQHHTDCIIDEVHEGLLRKKMLNYTSGAPNALPPALIKNALDLYALIDKKWIEAAPDLAPDYPWDAFKKELATKLLTDAKSPLFDWVAQAKLRYKETVVQELISYLMNTASETPRAVLDANKEDRATLAFLKFEISVMLTATLSQKLNKHYGASQRKHLSPAEEALAIPFIGGGTPNERSRFVGVVESVNKTIQMMVLTGINKAQLLLLIDRWQDRARQELRQKPALATLDATTAAKNFAALMPSLSLSQLEVNNSQQMMEVHAQLRWNRPLIFEFLQDLVLPQIQQEGLIISSNGFDHVGQFDSVQGISGTPSKSALTYHLGLEYDRNTSLGNDGFIMEVVRQKKPAIISLAQESPKALVKTLLAPSSRHTRAIIDICGVFAGMGIANEAVAQHIAYYIKSNPQQFNAAIKQVLYFNQEHTLCALLVEQPDKSIILGSSEHKELNLLLGSTADERFTYYHQLGTLGVDIMQAPVAHALVLVDDKLHWHQFIQGVMRLRGLSLGQTLDLIVPTSMQGISLDALYRQWTHNDVCFIEQEAPEAAYEQMRSYLRRRILWLLNRLPADNTEEKTKLIKSFHSFLINNPALDLWKSHGCIKPKQTIAAVLQERVAQLKQEWATCLQAAPNSFDAAQLNGIERALKHLFEKALLWCTSEYEAAAPTLGMEAEAQKEAHKEVHKEVQKVQERLQEGRDGRFVAFRIKQWPRRIPENFFSEEEKVPDLMISLDRFYDSECLGFHSPELRVSHNFLQTYNDQGGFLNAFLKPALVVWYHLDKEKLYAVLVTPQDAQMLESPILDHKNSWLSTMQDTVIAGNKPPSIEKDNNYQCLREQLLFFSGAFQTLIDEGNPLLSLTHNFKPRLDLFASKLLPFLPKSSSGLQQIRALLTAGTTEGLDYIASHPFSDLTQCNWLVLFPKTLPLQEVHYRRTATAFKYLNKPWDGALPSVNNLQEQFNLDYDSLGRIKRHLRTLEGLKKILTYLIPERYDPDNPFFMHCSLADQQCLAYCLGMSLKNLYPKHFTPPLPGQNPTKEQLLILSLLSIQMVQILRENPCCSNDLLDKYLAAVVQKSESEEVLNALAKTVNPHGILVQALVNHPRFDDKLMHSMLKTSKNLGEEVLMIFTERCHTPEAIDVVLEQNNWTEKGYQTLIKTKNQWISGASGLKLLRKLGKDVLGQLPLLKMIPLASESDLDLVIAHGTKSPEVLESLAQQVKSSAQINSLLACSDMSAKIADILLPKEAYCGKMAAWSWVTKEQLLFILDNKINNYVDAYQVFTHPKLSRADKEQWFAKVNGTLKEKQQKAKTPMEQLAVALEQLKIKACSHTSKALVGESYQKAAMTAFELHQAMHTATHKYNQNLINLSAYKKICDKAIADAKPVLQTHRSYKQLFFDIINLFVAVFSWLITRDWRFFKIKTESIKLVDAISEHVAQEAKKPPSTLF